VPGGGREVAHDEGNLHADGDDREDVDPEEDGPRHAAEEARESGGRGEERSGAGAAHAPAEAAAARAAAPSRSPTCHTARTTIIQSRELLWVRECARADLDEERGESEERAEERGDIRAA
jgi:hypothetical protein